MFWNRSPEEIQNHWQTDLETNMEMGTSPFLDLGITLNPFESTATLLALQASAVQRIDVTKPTLLMGGSDPAWLSALMLPAPVDLPVRAPEFTTIYGGTDVATYLANRAVTLIGIEDGRTSAENVTSREPRPYFSPVSHPGYSPPWESLPFLDVYGRPPVESAATAAIPKLSTDVIAWGAILGAIGLVVLAMFL